QGPGVRRRQAPCLRAALPLDGPGKRPALPGHLEHDPGEPEVEDDVEALAPGDREGDRPPVAGELQLVQARRQGRDEGAVLEHPDRVLVSPPAVGHRQIRRWRTPDVDLARDPGARKPADHMLVRAIAHQQRDGQQHGQNRRQEANDQELHPSLLSRRGAASRSASATRRTASRTPSGSQLRKTATHIAWLSSPSLKKGPLGTTVARTNGPILKSVRPHCWAARTSDTKPMAWTRTATQMPCR